MDEIKQSTDYESQTLGNDLTIGNKWGDPPVIGEFADHDPQQGAAIDHSIATGEPLFDDSQAAFPELLRPSVPEVALPPDVAHVIFMLTYDVADLSERLDLAFARIVELENKHE